MAKEAYSFVQKTFAISNYKKQKADPKNENQAGWNIVYRAAKNFT